VQFRRYAERGSIDVAPPQGRKGVVVTTVAALFVQKGGVYFNLDGVDPWDEERDARLYARIPSSRTLPVSGGEGIGTGDRA